MGRVRRFPAGALRVELAAAVDAFLLETQPSRAGPVRLVYVEVLEALIGSVGAATPLAEVTAPRVHGFLHTHYESNPSLRRQAVEVLHSAIRWWQARGWLRSDLGLPARSADDGAPREPRSDGGSDQQEP